MIDNDPARQWKRSATESGSPRTSPEPTARQSRLPHRRRAQLAPAAVSETRFIEGSGGRSTRSRRTTTPTGTPSTPWCSKNRPGPVTPRRGPARGRRDRPRERPFKPDERMRAVLQDAVTVGNATARTVAFAPRPEEGWAYYPGSAWFNMLFTGGYEFLDPPPQLTAEAPSPPQRRRPQAERAHRLLLPLHRHHPPPCACGLPASAPSTSSPCRQRRKLPRRRPQLPAHPAARHPREPVLVGAAV